MCRLGSGRRSWTRTLFDVRDLRFVLPPLERPPFASKEEKAQAILRMIRQAERERATGGDA